jgi:hypothetical protein
MSLSAVHKYLLPALSEKSCIMRHILELKFALTAFLCKILLLKKGPWACVFHLWIYRHVDPINTELTCIFLKSRASVSYDISNDTV